tara:strand:- start:8474 stop:8752 length:279 start_codon:yes stop_codon:yes gene_type:complete
MKNILLVFFLTSVGFGQLTDYDIEVMNDMKRHHFNNQEFLDSKSPNPMILIAEMDDIKKKKKKKGKKLKGKEKGKKGSWGIFKSKWKKKKPN